MIPLTGPESLFVRLGHIFGTFQLVNQQRGTQMPPHIDTVFADYENTDQNLTTNLYTNLQSFQNAMGTLPSSLQSLANNTLTQMVNEDIKQTSLTSIPVCMNTLISQMIDASATVQACNASSTVTADPENNGNPNVVIGLKNNLGLLQENSFAELIIGNVVSDSQTQGVTAGQESINFQGQYSVADQLSWLYPAGSNCNATVTCVNAAVNQNSGTQNNLNNSDFEDWTSNVPNNWVIAIGTAGTTVKQSTSVKYDGASSLQIVGNGSELTAVYQQFATLLASGNTSVPMVSVTQFAFNAWVKVDVAPASGVLAFSLVDGSNVVINDEQGTPNTISVNLATVGTTFVPISGFFRTPRVLPSSVRLMIQLTTALSGGSSVFIDRAAMAQPYLFYQGGPVVSVFSGSNILIDGDSFNLNIYNNYSGLFQNLFDRFFNMKSLNVMLPSSNSPTIPDSLII